MIGRSREGAVLGAFWADRVAANCPRQCELCRAWGRQPICADCVGRFTAPLPRCPRCALPCGESRICGECLGHPPAFDGAVAALSYAFPWDGLITRWKFRAQPELTRGLVQRLVEAVRREAAPEVDLLLPMPLGDARLRERGYNQAWELARCAGSRLGVAATPQLLRRWRDTPHQVGLSKAQREANLRNAMWVDPALAPHLRGRRIALVDDVMTTGASANAAALALRQAGAAEVQVWVLARTPRPD